MQKETELIMKKIFIIEDDKGSKNQIINRFKKRFPDYVISGAHFKLGTNNEEDYFKSFIKKHKQKLEDADIITLDIGLTRSKEEEEPWRLGFRLNTLLRSKLLNTTIIALTGIEEKELSMKGHLYEFDGWLEKSKFFEASTAELRGFLSLAKEKRSRITKNAPQITS